MRLEAIRFLRLGRKDVLDELGRPRGTLLGRQGKRGLEEVDEGSFARVARSQNKHTADD